MEFKLNTNLFTKYEELLEKGDFEKDVLFPDFKFHWPALLENRCPYTICHRKLKFPQSGKIAICSSKKHGKAFVISVGKLEEIINK